MSNNFEEADLYLEQHSDELEDFLMHYGIPRRSGRYPWGSGDSPYQRTGDILSRIEELKASGKTEKEIASDLGLTTTQLRIQKSLALSERRAILVERAESLKAKGYSNSEIAREMGYPNESSVRSLLNEKTKARMTVAQNTADILKKQIEEKGMIEVGTGVERELGVSRTQLDQALYMLELEGYPLYGVGVPQATNPGKQTNIKVICPKGTEHREVYNYENINSVKDYISDDGGETFHKAFLYPENMDISRLQINYAETGGDAKDGLIEIRRGVDDLSLGESHYAQVRIRVDGDRYLKGMAVYADDLPDGIDVRFNTNKSESVPPRDVLKPIKNDPDNPFGSLIKERGGQSHYIDENGEKRLSLINKRAEEGDWHEWSKTLPSQFLSKQNADLIRKQLHLAIADSENDLNDILNLENPTIKKALLMDYAENADKAAVQLKAASLPGTKYQVILPITSLKDNEIFAPTFKDGETVALVRYPHGGTFEIPIVKVNNKQKDARSIIGTDAKDAIGINSEVAKRLSGADFDGDTVMVIPLRNGIKITSKSMDSSPALKSLKDFDPKMEYGGKPEGTFKQMRNTQTEMGKISNLITDMTLKGATDDEIVRAVKHSMVVIDAEKHHLDYKQSEMDNGIAALKKKYQGYYDEDGRYRQGAATLISRAKSPTQVLKRHGNPWIDPETGEEVWERVNPKTGEKESKIKPEYYLDKNGVKKVRTQESTLMAETRDAFKLSSGTTQEMYYAEYANKMKALANKARKEAISTGDIKYSPSANKAYKNEVDHLNAQLKVSLMNAPRERKAQLMANSIVKAKIKANPDMTKKEIKKAKQSALTDARLKVGAKRNPITISDREWKAIQSGAISASTLRSIIKYSDKDSLRKLATPRNNNNSLTQFKINKMKAMKASGYTISEIAEALGVSSSTVVNNLKGGN